MSAVPSAVTSPSVRLDWLLESLASAPAIEVSDITLDSRAVRQGSVFFARLGTQRHGIAFAEQAVANGAAAIVYERAPDIARPVDASIPWIGINDLHRHLGPIAARFFGAPSERLRITAVTGTNGKTTVAWLVARALEQCGNRCAYIGTLGSGEPDRLEAASLTTPDVIEIQRRLADFVSAGLDYVALEASSHALDQGRLQDVQIETAVFTNLSRDHLDYHGTMERYAQAKARLFDVDGLCGRVISIDTDAGAALALRYPGAVWVSRTQRPGSERFAAAVDEQFGAHGVCLRVESHLGTASIRSSLYGDFNVSNLLCAFAALLEIGVDPDAAAQALSCVDAPPGRMQVVSGDMDARHVIVDFAHTPAALEAALRALRAHTTGQLWCIFGCGGDRDRGKRPEMGAVAESLADCVVVTSDNPRNEDPRAIIDDILGGFAQTASVAVIEDRGDAIRFAIERCNDGDVVLVAGKGHERTQEIAGTRVAFSDVDVARRALDEVAS